MRWKRVVWLSCLAPVAGGCHMPGSPTHDRVAEAGVGRTEAGIGREIRRDAREAWRAVRAQYPAKLFTAEFHDGFVDGYADYLDRGGSAQPPAVPPPRYTRNKAYFTPEGHARIRDYFLGFKYGVDVAVATGHREYLTVPVLVSDRHPAAVVGPADAVIPAEPADPFTRTEPAPAPLPAPRPLPADEPARARELGAAPTARPSLKPAEPVGPKAAGATPGGTSKVVPAVPTLSIPPLPGPGAAAKPTRTPKAAAIRTVGHAEADDDTPSIFPSVKPIFDDPVPAPPVKLPAPPAAVPDAPGPVGPSTDSIPVLPPTLSLPPQLPANTPDAAKK